MERSKLITPLLLIVAATPVYADVGVPMIVLVMPWMAISLVPIILLETW